eukprot:CAMPEP_0116948070 /NCGR_PEP_ID=MMETSP0467-20121206/38083_1 /TAXON_ID=283647 /ORGANISM="Mesodinium pulex, Strain SPMC105" /LENGTH=160 /DNA_ID=CAMNT_0004632411 /DNA_START=47 /DNA_END=526 /DNA_ORIENTATION=+
MAAADETFEKVDAGASETYPIRAGEVKKGHYLVIKGFPCKVIELTTSKTGKHGHAKANITALDIFTNKKYEEICPTSHNMTAPNVTKTEYTIMDINDEAFVSLMSEEGEEREDLTWPTPELNKELAERLEAVKADILEGEKSWIAIVQKAMGREGIIAIR